MDPNEKRSREELARALEESEKAYRELAVLSYSVAHDLRAPLRKIGGFSQILLEEHSKGLGEEAKQYLRRLQDAGQTMSRLLEALMKLVSLARAEARREPVDLSAIAQAAAEALREAEPGREVEFAIQPGVKALGDPDLLAEVLEDLLGNAWKFTSRHPRARIEFGTAEREGKTAYFVRDDGAGFDPLHAAKLFLPFQRLHAEAEFPGVGAGLAVVRAVVSLHGGEVSAEGELEKGATFFFTLGRPSGAA
ncbi:MAG TPA: ATP-binding protein [Elusimicrobiota bacterium]|nr:ATP-binding protein [Elusimicrobiota bacterium]